MGWVVSVTPRPRFASGKGLLVHIVQEGGLALQPPWTQRLEEKSFAPAGDRTPIARSSVRSQTLYSGSETRTQRQKNGKRKIYIVNIDKCQYDIQEQKEVPV
jgi:hypothetical protein